MIKLSTKLLAIAGLIASTSANAQSGCDDFECKLNRIASDCQDKSNSPDDAYTCFKGQYEKQVCDIEERAGLGCMLAAAGISNDLKSNRYKTKKDTDWKAPVGDLQFESYAIQKIGHSDDKSSTHQLTLVCNDSNLMIGYQTVDSETFFASDENKMTDDSTVSVSFDKSSAAEIKWGPTPKDSLILLSPENSQNFVDRVKASETFVITTNTPSGLNTVNFEVGNLDVAFPNLGECAE